MFFAHHACVLQLRQTKRHALGGRHIRKHAHKQILYKLKSGNRSSELLALTGISQCMLVGPLATSDRFPRHTGACHAQHRGRVLEGIRAFASRFSSETRQSWRLIVAFWTTRSAILCFIFSVEKPAVPFSTTKALT